MKIQRILAATVLLGAAGAASAHPGHGVQTLFDGLVHPFGADHLLAMVAVGVWSAVAFRGGQRWRAPATFLAAMIAGALLGLTGLAAPALEAWTEGGIALSVVVFGAMLMAGPALPAGAGLVLVAAAAGLHGLAHGAELPAGASFGVYAAGFLSTTAALHGAGLGLGRALAQARAGVWRALGGALGAAGLLLLTRV